MEFHKSEVSENVRKDVICKFNYFNHPFKKRLKKASQLSS
jgi:hypothetical protein